MAKKKLSGAQRDRLAPITYAMKASPVFSRLVRKRGRPKGSAAQQTKQLREDFEWAVRIGRPGMSDMDIAEALLQDDSVRTEELLLSHCKYRDVKKDSVRRVIALMRSQNYEPRTPLRVRYKNNKPKPWGANFYPTKK